MSEWYLFTAQKQGHRRIFVWRASWHWIVENRSLNLLAAERKQEMIECKNTISYINSSWPSDCIPGRGFFVEWQQDDFLISCWERHKHSLIYGLRRAVVVGFMLRRLPSCKPFMSAFWACVCGAFFLDLWHFYFIILAKRWTASSSLLPKKSDQNKTLINDPFLVDVQQS